MKLRDRDHEVLCNKESFVESLSKELPSGTIRYSSKVVSFEESAGFYKLVHLADGTILRTKVLIGCDGVNSIVSKWLGFKKPKFTGRYALRGSAFFNTIHGFEPKFMQFFGERVRSGLLPCDNNTAYWFFTWTPSSQDQKELVENPAKMKHELDGLLASPLRYRPPWEILWGHISKGNVCVAGDALHPMTPDIGQGGCAALEDGVVLARCLGEAISGAKDKPDVEGKEECQRIEMGLKKYAKERRWRSFELIATSHIVGIIQQSGGRLMTSMRDKFFAVFLAGLLLKMVDFDCGSLSVS
ncbi:hypothetical protein FNV43_RR21847 [Rhamnella rubrinervis]|uniref:FAD-binding domain-containing protein n=1 Tax=Rhamnella rubrinervis TaxID=2594499 RepID=A0A8K0DP46_9ROSA|nr:hypothetical protein FNV43_RR21847 [Rhamnella rubrinervis]